MFYCRIYSWWGIGYWGKKALEEIINAKNLLGNRFGEQVSGDKAGVAQANH